MFVAFFGELYHRPKKLTFAFCHQWRPLKLQLIVGGEKSPKEGPYVLRNLHRRGWMFPKIGVFTPPIIHLFIRFSLIIYIYKPSILGGLGYPPYFWFNTQCVGLTKRPSSNFLGGDPAIWCCNTPHQAKNGGLLLVCNEWLGSAQKTSQCLFLGWKKIISLWISWISAKK